MKLGLSYKSKPTRPVTYAEMMRLVAAADEAGEASIGTAAMIAFFWLQPPSLQKGLAFTPEESVAVLVSPVQCG